MTKTEERLAVFLPRSLGMSLSPTGILGSGEVSFRTAMTARIVLEHTGKFIDEEFALETDRVVSDDELTDALRSFYEHDGRKLSSFADDGFSVYDDADNLLCWITVSNESRRPSGKILVTTNKM